MYKNSQEKIIKKPDEPQGFIRFKKELEGSELQSKHSKSIDRA